ncbi:hypothetical protein FHG87_022964 [Trinorchestia longiramus]|nr:hypothetical protein FHG87_022964 [Trinorchestia longiramus]
MGVGVMQTKNEVLLEQSAYTKALLSRFGMDEANSVATPVDVNADLVTTSDEVEDCDKDLYQSAVGGTFKHSTLQTGHSYLKLDWSNHHLDALDWLKHPKNFQAISRANFLEYKLSSCG